MAATNVQAFSGDVEISSNLAVNTDDLFVDTTTGRVGIGVTNPSDSILDVAGTLRVGDGTLGLINLGRTGTVDTRRTGFIYHDGSDLKIANQEDGELKFTTNNGEKMSIKSSGNVAVDGITLFVNAVGNKVGIGTTNPLGSLHLATTGDFYISNTSDKDTANERIGRIYFYNGTNLAGAAIESCVNVTGANNNADLRFFTSLDNNNRNIERMRIVRNGNVGIGTTDPAKAKLQVNNTIALLNPAYKTNADDDQTAGEINFYLGGSAPELATPVAGIVGYDKYRTGGSGYVGALAFKTMGGENMRIENGNVGIGVTNPAVRLAVNGSLSFTSPWISSSSITITQFNSNNFFNCIPTNTVGGYTGYKVQIRYDPSPGAPPYAACAYVDWFSIGTNSNQPQYNAVPLLTTAHAPNGLDQTMVVSGTMGGGVTNSGLRLRTYSNYYTGTFTTRWHVIGTNV